MLFCSIKHKCIFLYGNTAALLLSHGLLSGGRSEGEAEYSSDSETSDTEEYQQSQPQ